MRAIICDGTSARLDTACRLPEPGIGEAVVRLRRAAISAFDAQTARGLTGFRGVMGHQFVGVVESVHGDAAASRKLVNQRVVGSIIHSCGACDLCRKGLSQHCRDRTIMGMVGRGGCLAERLCVPTKQLVTVPTSVDDDRAVFAVDIAGALHAAQQVTLTNRPYVTVLGDGTLALLTAQIMVKMNASVRVVGRQPARFGLCEKWGIKHRAVDEVGLRADQDVVIDCTGSADGLAVALGMVRPRGKIVLKTLWPGGAGAEEPLAGSLSALVLHEVELIGSFLGPMHEAVTALAENQVDVLSLISKRFNLSDGVAAIKAASAVDALKVVVSGE